MLSERSPSVTVKEVAAGVPSGSTMGIDMTSVLGPIRHRCRRGSGNGLHREDHQGASLIRDLSLISTVNLCEGRETVAHERSLRVTILMGEETRLSWLPAVGVDRERGPHTQHTAPCPPGVPPPRRSRRSGADVCRRGAASWGAAVGLLLMFQDSQCTSGTTSRIMAPIRSPGGTA